MSKTYVMVTGPAASGKSELCKAVSNNLSAQFYKPAHAYFELAKKYNIPNERVFFDINPNEAIAHFCNVCKAYELVIGDQHLAIQHKRDSALATNQITEIDISEPYVSALDYSLFDKLSDVEVKTLLIYLKANPEILYERAYRRHLETGAPLRNRNLQEVKDEINAEEFYFNELIIRKKLENYIINTDNLTLENVYVKAKKHILERKK